MWAEGDVIVRREVLNDGRAVARAPGRRRARRAGAARDLHRRGNAVSLPGRRLADAERAHPWHGRTRWEGHGVLMLQRPGEAHAIWVFWHGPEREFTGWYVNLQEPFRRTRDRLRHPGSRARHLGAGRRRLGVEGRRRCSTSASARAATPPSRSRRPGPRGGASPPSSRPAAAGGTRGGRSGSPTENSSEEKPAILQVPMRFLELVKCRSGNIAKGNCSASTTWLSVSRSVTLLSPRIPMMRTAGRIARPRVINRRTQGRIRQCMKPSITTCPASVPVMVLLWPLASSATANNVLARAVPKSGASVRYATRIQSLSALKLTTCPPASVTLSLP